MTASDPVHFLDDFNWLTGGLPEQLFAIRRDHLGRGLDDLALILLEHPGGVVGKVEAGLIQPGRHVDLIAPGALTSKEVVAARGAIEIDFPAERLVWHRVRHQLQDGLFRPVFEDARIKHLPAATAVDCWRASSGSSSATSPDIARLLEAIGRSAQTGHRVACARPDG